MAGARGRKIDLSGYLSGNANVANIIANTDQSGGIGGLLRGVAGGISQAGANIRENKRFEENRADRLARQRIQDKETAFRNDLLTKASARADAELKIRQDDEKRKVASNAANVETTAGLLARAQAAAATGMPMDPKVLDEIHRRSTAIQAAGGPVAIMSGAADQVETDPEGLVRETAQLDSLAKSLVAQREQQKTPEDKLKIDDAVMELSGHIAANRARLKLHDANVSRKATADAKAAEAKAKIDDETAKFQALAPGRFPDLTDVEMRGAAASLAHGDPASEALSNIQTGRDKAAQAQKDAESKARQDERLRITQENHDLAIKGFKLREEAAARAVKEGNLKEYEAGLKEAKDAVESAKYKIDLAAKYSGTMDEIERAKTVYFEADRHLAKMEAMRPRATPTESPTPAPVPAGAATSGDDEAKAAARARYDALPDAQKTPQMAASLLAEERAKRKAK